MKTEIVSPANPRLKELLDARENWFFFAGDKLVNDLLARPLRVDKLLVRTGLDVGLPPPQAEVGEHWRVSPRVMAKVSGMKSPPGLVAVLALPETRIDFRRCRVVVGLIGIQDPGNLGTVFRCASAFNLPALALAGGVRPNHPKAIRAAQTALLDVPFQVFPGPNDLLAAARAAAARVYVTGSRPGGVQLDMARMEFPCLLLFGTEGLGLDPRLLESFPRVRLDQEQRIDSLNVGISACILMHELRRLHGR